MKLFFRVRSSVVGDPDREFDVPFLELERYPHLYVVLDPVPSPVFRKPVIRPGVIQPADEPRVALGKRATASEQRVALGTASKKSAPAKRRRASKPGEKATAPDGA